MYEIVDGYFGPKVRGKLGRQRKPQTYSVMPRSDGLVMVQGDSAIGVFDPATRQGRLNIKGGYFPHLNYALGAEDYEFPANFVALAMEVMPEPGGETSRGGVTVVHTVKVI
jgi:hypothetical protein